MTVHSRWPFVKPRPLSAGHLLLYTVFVIAMEATIWPTYLLQWRHNSYLHQLRPEAVAAIEIDSQVWTAPQDIGPFVAAFNQSMWYGSTYKSGMIFEPLTMRLASGEVLSLQVSRHPHLSGALLVFPKTEAVFGLRARHPNAVHIPDLDGLLAQRGYDLPGEVRTRPPLSTTTAALLCLSMLAVGGSGVAFYLARRKKGSPSPAKLPQPTNNLQASIRADLRQAQSERPSVNRASVLSAIDRFFPEADPTEILAQLDQYGPEKTVDERAWVQLAILNLSAGDLAQLQDYVDLALIDYRDVLMMAYRRD
jgi:hypothetical protein